MICPNCTREIERDRPAHLNGCVLGAMLDVIEVRGQLGLGAVDLAHLDVDGIWDRLGPLVDELEAELIELGAIRLAG